MALVSVHFGLGLHLSPRYGHVIFVYTCGKVQVWVNAIQMLMELKKQLPHVSKENQTKGIGLSCSYVHL